jgi:hypothetical protein
MLKMYGNLPWLMFPDFFPRAFAEANLRKSFGESFAAVVFPFAGPCYFNAPSNYLLDAAH